MREKKNRERGKFWTKQFFPQPDKKLVIGKLFIRNNIDFEVFMTCPRWMYLVVAGLRRKVDGNDEVDTITAMAKCYSGDKYEEDVGIDIVSEKLDMKYHMKMASRYWRICNLLREVVDRLSTLAITHSSKAYAIKKDLHEYYFSDRRHMDE